MKLEWHDRRDPRASLPFPNILVVDFQGSCDPRAESAIDVPLDGWLARMHISDGVVLPFGEVNCDLVRALMSDGTPKEKPSDKGFGRALARVLAHELYHFIAQSTDHTAQGLVKPSFSRADLVLGGLRLDRQELSRLSKSMLPQ